MANDVRSAQEQKQTIDKINTLIADLQEKPQLMETLFSGKKNKAAIVLKMYDMTIPELQGSYEAINTEFGDNTVSADVWVPK